MVKIGVSFISMEQAKKNLSLEISETDTFDTVMERAKAQWNEIMNTVEVDGASEQQLERLYSSLYKMYLFPKNYSENAGTAENPQPKYASPYKSTADNIVVNDGQMYAGNGFWDTYRTEWPALFLLSPKKAGELLDGMLEHYRDAGKMPRWSNPGGILSMIATNFDAVFGDAASKGIEFDTETAYEASLRAAASCFGDNGYERNYSETAPYIGYTQDTGDGGNSSISWTLEAAITTPASQISQRLSATTTAMNISETAPKTTPTFSTASSAFICPRTETAALPSQMRNLTPTPGRNTVLWRQTVGA